MPEVSSVDLRQRHGAPADPPQPSRRSRKKGKKKAQAQAQPQPLPTPKSSKMMKAAIGVSVFGALLTGLTMTGRGDENLVAKPERPEPKRIPPVDPDLLERPDDWQKTVRQMGKDGRTGLDAQIIEKYCAFGLEDAPQRACIEALSSPNPGTTPDYNGFNDAAAQRFDELAQTRKTVEQRAKNSGAADKFFPITRETLTADRYMNVRYLDASEREACLVSGNRDGAMVDPDGKPLSPGRHLMVVSPGGNIYTSPIYEDGVVHHSSFRAGEPITFAGEVVIGEGGMLREINNMSGHYLPDSKSLIVAASAIGGANIKVPEDIKVLNVSPT